jgi:short-subunit dehydrogenase
MKHIVITGASSGIGEALAIEYANSHTRLALSGRNQSRLQKVAEACRAKGAIVEEKVIDVIDRAAMTKWLLELDMAHPIDLVVANAGISSGSNSESNWEENTRDIFAINMAGTLNTILPIIPRMRQRGKGQIALMSSMAGFRGLASAPAYSASKAAVKAYGEAIRMKYKNDGLKVSIICPGFVESRITDKNQFKMPFLMKGDKAAKYITKGLQRNKAIIAFPWPMVATMNIVAALPLWLMEILATHLPSKE